MDPLRIEFTVACPPERAFALWAEQTSRWWPHGHSVSGEPGLSVIFEPGGRIFERTPEGFEHDWGEVLAWEPPHRLVYLWHLRFDRSDATEVEVTFAPHTDGTAVTIEHRGWERLGAQAEQRRERNRLGWGGVTPRYRIAALIDADALVIEDWTGEPGLSPRCTCTTRTTRPGWYCKAFWSCRSATRRCGPAPATRWAFPRERPTPTRSPSRRAT